MRILILTGILVHVLIFFYCLLPSHDTTKPKEKHSFIQFPHNKETTLNSIFDEQSQLFDAEPLLLHTQWNYREPLDLRKITSDQAFFFAPYPAITEVKSLSETTKINIFPKSKPEDTRETVFSQVLNTETLSALQGFTIASRLPPTPSSHTPHAKITSLDNPRIIHSVFADSEFLNDLPSTLWSPLRINIFIHDDGHINAPFLIQSSGDPVVDKKLLDWLSQLLNSQKLPAGYYTTEIAP